MQNHFPQLGLACINDKKRKEGNGTLDIVVVAERGPRIHCAAPRLGDALTGEEFSALPIWA